MRPFRLSFNPWRPQLNTAGHQSSAPEGDLWRCQNGAPDLDGMISKRPGLTQWGSTIKRPDPDATDSTLTQFVDFLNGTTGFSITDGSSGTITTNTVLGEMRTNVASGSSSEYYRMSYGVSDLSATSEWSLRFQFRGVNLPAYTAAGTSTNAFSFRVQAQSATATAKEFAIWSGGLYWKADADDTYALVTGSARIGAGTWNTIEVRCDDAAGSTTVYMNDTLLETLTSSDLKDMSLTGTSAFEFRWDVEGSGDDGTQYSTRMATVMYNDTITDPFEAVPVTALTGFQQDVANSTRRHLLIAAGDYIYHDRYLENCWRPLYVKRYANIHFSPYRTNVVWLDSNGAGQSSLILWDGSTTVPEVQDEDTIPAGQYCTEHQQRLLIWGADEKRRLYYSGDRRLDRWYSPSPDNVEDDFNTVLDAGYKEIPSSGRAIKAVVGDFFGQAIVAGEKGFWKLSGNGVFSFRLDGLKSSTGASNALSMAQVGNDVWAVGPQGITSLSAVQQFGDIQAAQLSVPIQNLWSPSGNAPTYINSTFINESRIAYNSRSATVAIAVPLKADQTPVRIFVRNMNTQKFYGEWDVDAQALAVVEVASPVTEVIMVGDTSGRVGYFNPFTRFDYGGDAYTLTLESMSHNGRSLDPKLVPLTKVWRTLRLWFVPRGHWEYTVTWWTDDDTEAQSFTLNQNDNEFVQPTLDFDLTLDDEHVGRLTSGDVTVFQDIDLNARGRELTFSITQTGAGQDFAPQGYELEGLVAGYEEG